jgi:hypothetical protein
MLFLEVILGCPGAAVSDPEVENMFLASPPIVRARFVSIDGLPRALLIRWIA